MYPIPANTTFDVPSGVTQSIWVSFTVSEEAIPGHNITGEISLSASKTVFKIPFNLQVSNVTLPSLSDSKIGTAWSGSWTSSTFEPYYNSFDWNKSKKQVVIIAELSDCIMAVFISTNRDRSMITYTLTRTVYNPLPFWTCAACLLMIMMMMIFVLTVVVWVRARTTPIRTSID